MADGGLTGFIMALANSPHSTNGDHSKKNVIDMMMLVVTTIACIVAAVEASVTRSVFKEEMRRRARPALVPSAPGTATVVGVPSGLRLIARVPLLNQGGGPAYRLRFFKCLQIPPLSQATASKEAILSSLVDCKAAFGVTASNRASQLVVGNGQSYDAELIDEVTGGFPTAGSPMIKRRIYVLCLYENEAQKEMGTVFSISFEFMLSNKTVVETHVEDAGVLEY